MANLLTTALQGIGALDQYPASREQIAADAQRVRFLGLRRRPEQATVATDELAATSSQLLDAVFVQLGDRADANFEARYAINPRLLESTRDQKGKGQQVVIGSMLALEKFVGRRFPDGFTADEPILLAIGGPPIEMVEELLATEIAGNPILTNGVSGCTWNEHLARFRQDWLDRMNHDALTNGPQSLTVG